MKARRPIIILLRLSEIFDMAKILTVSVAGIKIATATLNRLKQAAIDDINDEMYLSALAVQEKAILNIRNNGANDQGFLLKGMVLQEDYAARRFETGNIMYYSPYVEFGTGRKVSVPSEWAQYASQFKGKANHGNFEQFVQNLIDWMKRKGITPNEGNDEKDYRHVAILMAMDIYQNGLTARPFLYPAYQEVVKDLKKRVLAIIKKAT